MLNWSWVSVSLVHWVMVARCQLWFVYFLFVPVLRSLSLTSIYTVQHTSPNQMGTVLCVQGLAHAQEPSHWQWGHVRKTRTRSPGFDTEPLAYTNHSRGLEGVRGTGTRTRFLPPKSVSTYVPGPRCLQHVRHPRTLMCLKTKIRTLQVSRGNVSLFLWQNPPIGRTLP